MIRGILLDLDKTLVNVLDYVDYCSALRALFKHLGREVNADVPETYWGVCASKAMETLVALSGSVEWDTASNIIEEYEIKGAGASTPMHGLGRFMDEVGKFDKKAIVTLLGPKATQIVIQIHKINVDAVVSRSRDFKPKPYPDQVLQALKLLDIRPSEAVMVGDSEWDEKAAVSAGVCFIGVTNRRPVHHFKSSIAVVEDLHGACEVLRALRKNSLVC